MKKNNSSKMIIFDFILFVVLTLIDQYTKYLSESLKNNNPIVLINGVLEFRYLENHGAAFGILQGKQLFFLIMSIIVFIIITFVIFRIPQEKKYIIFNMILSFILAGALGNTIDRYLYGYVRDFIYFSLIDFPIFNVADIYITVTTFLLVFIILFVYKEDDLVFLNLKEKN